MHFPLLRIGAPDRWFRCLQNARKIQVRSHGLAGRHCLAGDGLAGVTRGLPLAGVPLSVPFAGARFGGEVLAGLTDVGRCFDRFCGFAAAWWRSPLETSGWEGAPGGPGAPAAASAGGEARFLARFRGWGAVWGGGAGAVNSASTLTSMSTGSRVPGLGAPSAGGPQGFWVQSSRTDRVVAKWAPEHKTAWNFRIRDDCQRG